MFVFLYLFAEFIVVLPEGILTLFELKNLLLFFVKRRFKDLKLARFVVNLLIFVFVFGGKIIYLLL